ncbi:TPA: YraN family protein, partial [Clostridioides difficile]|nr:YraN family protein [Clostridioides difficile]
MNNKEKGDFGEEIAVNYLLSKGARILEKNYRLKIGEIDI